MTQMSQPNDEPDDGMDEDLDEGEVPAEVRSRLALALDVDDIVAARRLAFDLEPFFGTVKVGLELFCATGSDTVSGFAGAGFDVFCDLKLHDIPTTVEKAARVVGSLGARWRRTTLAVESGCAGIVCAATDLEATAPWADRLVRVVPGTRLPGADAHDQARVTTPIEASEGGADLLVVGRSVTAAEEPILAAAELVGHLLG